jgi:uncharacterized membrane protein HdeD (DUF308 family)
MNVEEHERKFVSELFNPLDELAKVHWTWFLFLGVALVLLGTAALGSAFVATVVAMRVLSVLLIFGGISQSVLAFRMRHLSGILALLLMGILYLVVGILTVGHPLQFAEELTLLIACFLIFGGTFRIITALLARFPHWGWVLMSGIITLALGIMIWRQWPASSFWVIGTFIGVDLLFNGWAWIMLAFTMRNVSRPSSAP